MRIPQPTSWFLLVWLSIHFYAANVVAVSLIDRGEDAITGDELSAESDEDDLVIVLSDNNHILSESEAVGAQPRTTSTTPATFTCPTGCLCEPGRDGEVGGSGGSAGETAPLFLESVVCSCKEDGDDERLVHQLPYDVHFLDNPPYAGGPSSSKKRHRYRHAEDHIRRRGAAADNASHFELHGGAFDLMTVRRGFIVHACRRVTVHRNAFVGAELGEQLRFVDVEQLVVESNAFAGIRRSPRQIVVQDCGVERLAASSMIGLADVDHFWWRNVSVRRVERLAFFKLSNVSYLYFREASFDVIEAGAFAHMHRVRHLFFRKRIRVRRADAHLFVGSRVDELMVEDASFLHVADAAWLGVEARRVRMENCHFHVARAPTTTAAVRDALPRGQRVAEWTWRNCTVNRLALSDFYNVSVLRLERVNVGELVPSSVRLRPDATSTARFHIGDVHLRHCHIGQWHTDALPGATHVDVLTVADSRILAVRRAAIRRATVGRFALLRSRVKSVASRAFSAARFDAVDWERVDVVSLGAELFYRVRITGALTWRALNARYVDSRVLASLAAAARVTIERANFGEFPAHALDDSNITSLVISDSRFVGGHFNASIFARLRAARLVVARSEFFCAPRACETNALLLRSTAHSHVAWTFRNNRCVRPLAPRDYSILVAAATLSSAALAAADGGHVAKSESSSGIGIGEDSALADAEADDDDEICSTESKTLNGDADGGGGGLVCRRRIFIEECVCVEPTTASSMMDGGEQFPVVRLPETSARILLVGDCRNLVVDRRRRESGEASVDDDLWRADDMTVTSETREIDNSTFSSPEFLYIYRVDRLEVGDLGGFPALRQIHLLYSTIRFTADAAEKEEEGQTTDINNVQPSLDELRLTGSVVESMDARSFAGRRVGRLIINGTMVRDVSPTAFTRAKVRRVEFWHSDLLAIGDMLEHVDEMRVEGSRLPRRPQSSQTGGSATAVGGEYNSDEFDRHALTAYERCVLGGRRSAADCRQHCRQSGNCERISENGSGNETSPMRKRCAGNGTALPPRECHTDGGDASLQVSLVYASSTTESRQIPARFWLLVLSSVIVQFIHFSPTKHIFHPLLHTTTTNVGL